MRAKNPLSWLQGRWNKLLALAVGVALVVTFLHTQKPHPRPVHELLAASAGATDVEVSVAESVLVPVAIEGVGTVRSRRQSELAARIVAQVLEVRVEAGARVGQGDLLVKLDDLGLRSSLEEAEATLRSLEERRSEAQTELDRTKNLFAREATTKQLLDAATFRLAEAVARREAAAKSLEQARITLSYAELRAPFAGIVHRREVDPGDLATPGKTLLGLYDPQELRLEASLDEQALRGLRVGAPVAVAIDALEERLDGSIAELAPEVEAATRTGMIKVDLPGNAALRPGMFGRASIPVRQRPAIVVPREAVVRRGQLELVFTLDDAAALPATSSSSGPPAPSSAAAKGQARARMRLVRFGDVLGPDAERVEVTSGLEAGARVITRGARDLRDGDPIQAAMAPPGGGEGR